MYVIREVLNCKPGKVRQMLEKFRSISAVMKETGREPMRLLTDVTSADHFAQLSARQSIHAATLELVRNARHFLVLDYFLTEILLAILPSKH